MEQQKNEAKRQELLKETNRIFADSIMYEEFERLGYCRLIKAAFENREFDNNSLLISGLKMVLSGLGKEKAEVIRMRYWETHTVREVGNRFGVSDSSVCIMCRRVLEKLRTSREVFEIDLQIQSHEMAIIYLKKLKSGERFTEDAPIEKLNISARAYNCLKRNGINTVEQVASLSETELMQIRTVGRTTALEIIRAVRQIEHGWGVPLKPIEMLGLSERTMMALKNHGVTTIEQLFALQKEELIKIKNIGEQGLLEILDKYNA